MNTKTLSAIINKEEDLYVAQCPEIGTVSQGESLKEAIANLKEPTELNLKKCTMPKLVSLPITTTFEQENQFSQENEK